jgi:usherin
VVSVYEGTDIAFVDTDTEAATTYSYTVKTSTDGGSSFSSPAFLTLFQEPPSAVEAPTLKALEPTVVEIVWNAPTTLNGLNRYVVLVDGVQVGDATAVDDTRRVEIDALTPFTTYDIAITACNAEACQVGVAASVTLPSANPEGISTPTLTPTENGDGFQVSWIAASQQNGVLFGYQVFLRLASQLSTSEQRVCTEATPTDTSCAIKGLTPTTDYVVRVVYLNVDPTDGTTSDDVEGTTSSLRPQGVVAPTAIDNDETVLVVQIVEPSTPNGDILSYKITLDGQVVKTVSTPGTYTLDQLTSFTDFEVAVQACNDGGCTSSSSTSMSTTAAPPTDQGFPTLTAIIVTGPTFNVNVSWQYPSFPNGPLKTFQVQRREITKVDVATITTIDVVGR